MQPSFNTCNLIRQLNITILPFGLSRYGITTNFFVCMHLLVTQEKGRPSTRIRSHHYWTCTTRTLKSPLQFHFHHMFITPSRKTFSDSKSEASTTSSLPDPRKDISCHHNTCSHHLIGYKFSDIKNELQSFNLNPLGTYKHHKSNPTSVVTHPTTSTETFNNSIP